MANDGTADAPAGPLLGIRVLDFGTFIAGAFTGVLLGDMGADVIKIEPTGGDPARAWSPSLAGEGRSFQGWNRNKKSLAIDLATPRGLEIVHKLAAEVDVVIENFRPGTTRKLRIDYETIKAINPRIVYCSTTGFGSRGPHRDRPAYDSIVQAMSGIADKNVEKFGKLVISSVAICDYSAAMLASNGILAALLHREKTGEGQLVETSLLQSVMTIQSHVLIEGGETPQKGARGQFPYTFFETKDGAIFVAALTNKFWKLLCEALGDAELGENPDYATNALRSARKEELTEKVQGCFSKKTTEEWLAVLVEKGVPAGPVNTREEFFHSPQVEAMEMNPVIEHGKIGPIRVVGTPVRFSATPGKIQRAAPQLGEHGREILAGLGLANDEIEALESQGVIRRPPSHPKPLEGPVEA